MAQLILVEEEVLQAQQIVEQLYRQVQVVLE
jgi:hypothetical protein